MPLEVGWTFPDALSSLLVVVVDISTVGLKLLLDMDKRTAKKGKAGPPMCLERMMTHRHNNKNKTY